MHPARSLLFAFVVLCAPLVQAQPLIDGVSVGIGLSSYHGELDWNPDNGPAEFLAAGNLGAFVAADRSFGPVATEAALRLDRLAIDFPDAEMSINMLSLDVNVGPIFDVVRPGFLRLYAGVSPTLVLSNYNEVDIEELRSDGYEFDEQSVRFMLTFPIGVVFQDVLRLGLRITPSDDFDSVTGNNPNLDLLTFVSVGYRFDLLR